MGKKNKQIITTLIPFPYQKLINYFLLFFMMTLPILLALTPLLSYAKITLVRVIVHWILGSKTPYIHNIPFFKSISFSLPVFASLFLGYRKVSVVKLPSLKKDLKGATWCLLILWMLEIGSHVLEITITKLNITAFLPNYSITFLLSIGSISFPILLWLIVFHPSFLD